MSVTISKEKYPALGGTTGTSGKRIALYLNYGTSASVESPVWVMVGGCTSHSLNISAEVTTASTKEQGYWNDGVVTSKSAELSCECIMKKDNEAQEAIEAFVMQDDITAEKGALNFALVNLDDKTYVSMWAIPNSWEITADSEDLVTKSLTATVVGVPEQKTGFN